MTTPLILRASVLQAIDLSKIFLERRQIIATYISEEHPREDRRNAKSMLDNHYDHCSQRRSIRIHPNHKPTIKQAILPDGTKAYDYLIRNLDKQFFLLTYYVYPLIYLTPEEAFKALAQGKKVQMIKNGQWFKIHRSSPIETLFSTDLSLVRIPPEATIEY